MLSAQLDGYEIMPYEPRFREQLLALQAHLWGHDSARNASYLDWKYVRNPYISAPVLYVAMRGGEIVGTRGMASSYWEAGLPANRFACLADADAVVHPDHRRRGLLEAMTAQSLEDFANSSYEYIITLSARRSTAANNLKLGWKSTGFVTVARRRPVGGRLSAVRRLARRLPFLAAAYRRLRSPSRPAAMASPGNHPFDMLDRNGAAASSARRHICLETAARPEAMAALVERLGHDGRIRHVRDDQYFAWRYANPRAHYRFLFWADPQLQGYLVLHTSMAPGAAVVVTIVDWEAASPEVRADVLDAALGWGRFAQVMAWAGGLDGATLLRQRGFEILAADDATGYDLCPGLLVRALRPGTLAADWHMGGRNLVNLDDWDLRPVYSDNY